MVKYWQGVEASGMSFIICYSPLALWIGVAKRNKCFVQPRLLLGQE